LSASHGAFILQFTLCAPDPELPVILEVPFYVAVTVFAPFGNGRCPSLAVGSSQPLLKTLLDPKPENAAFICMWMGASGKQLKKKRGIATLRYEKVQSASTLPLSIAQQTIEVLRPRLDPINVFFASLSDRAGLHGKIRSSAAITFTAQLQARPGCGSAARCQ
jgi:hypothetical protein